MTERMKKGHVENVKSVVDVEVESMLDCGMLEFPCTGNKLSWAGKRTNGTVRCRLDRALGNEDWHEKFPHSKVQYLRMWGSDHRPVLADILSKPTRKRKTFKFDKRWLESEEIRQVILDGWNSSDLSPDASKWIIYPAAEKHYLSGKEKGI
ncbi:uncharacterized protein LOC106392926 [Brassica napus]|uniref:uncharacterized protein LOC106392926 n=1 Tax=Brassica napus TaxID=3708 RepID=UPI0006AB4F3E|nr:uncharacterized protein LOC106392926 [Brassica napus]